jgi:hypothetical protein
MAFVVVGHGLRGKWSSPGEAHFLNQAKMKLKRLWEKEYKSDSTLSAPRASKSPEPSEQVDFLESIINEMMPPMSRVERLSTHRDELAVYLEEALNSEIPLMECWRIREAKWPPLTKMALDF